MTGARLMLSATVDKQQLLPILCKEITEQLALLGMSSMHWLFVEQDISKLLHEQGQVQRIQCNSNGSIDSIRHLKTICCALIHGKERM